MPFWNESVILITTWLLRSFYSSLDSLIIPMLNLLLSNLVLDND